MNGGSYYHGLVTARRASEINEEIRSQHLHPKRTVKMIKRKIKLVTRHRRINDPGDVRKHRVKIEVGFNQGKPVHETLVVSLNELKEGLRSSLVGDGSYEAAAQRITRFYEGRLAAETAD